MESESLPPSMADAERPIAAHHRLHASNMCAPSPGSFAAYIQLPEYLTSLRPVVLAKTRLVTASPTVIRAIAAGDHALDGLLADARGAAGDPVVGLRDDADVRDRYLQRPDALLLRDEAGDGPVHLGGQEALAAHRRKAEDAVESVRRRGPLRKFQSLGLEVHALELVRLLGHVAEHLLEVEVLAPVGEPSGAVGSTSLTRPLPSMLPRTLNGHRSRAQIFSMTGKDSGAMSIALFSWYSAPHISSTERVASPSFTARMLSSPPLG